METSAITDQLRDPTLPRHGRMIRNGTTATGDLLRPAILRRLDWMIPKGTTAIGDHLRAAILLYRSGQRIPKGTLTIGGRLRDAILLCRRGPRIPKGPLITGGRLRDAALQHRGGLIRSRRKTLTARRYLRGFHETPSGRAHGVLQPRRGLLRLMASCLPSYATSKVPRTVVLVVRRLIRIGCSLIPLSEPRIPMTPPCCTP